MVRDEFCIVGQEVDSLDESGDVLKFGSESASNYIVGVGHAFETLPRYI